MTCDDRTVKPRLDDYVDGLLPDEVAAEVRRHLERCEECREEVAALRALLADARALPRRAAPPRDLWPGIAGRLRDRRPPAAGLRPWHAIAAALLLTMASTAVGVAIGRRLGAPQPVAAAPLPPELVVIEADYVRAADDLARVLEERRPALSPRTVAVLERSLRIIDAAIAESRAALARDPANRDLTTMLWATYEKKLDLLERATAGSTRL